MLKKQSSQHRRWIGTLNNPDLDVVQSFLEHWVTRHKCVYSCGQIEKGKEGTVHLQYALAFKNGHRLAQLKSICKQSHFEPVEVDNGVDAYCMKEETRIDGPWEFGVRPVQRNSKTDWARCLDHAKKGEIDKIPASIQFQHYKTIQAIQKDNMPDAEIRIQNPKTCIWLWGDSRAGKSTESRGVPHYLKLGTKWWDGYQGQRRVVLDDLGKDCAKALTDKIKLWADPNFNQHGETKGGAILLKYDEFIVTSNYHPYEIWGDTKDYEPIKMRFKISEEMKRDPDFKKDDEEEIDALELLRIKNKGFE